MTRLNLAQSVRAHAHRKLNRLIYFSNSIESLPRIDNDLRNEFVGMYSDQKFKLVDYRIIVTETKLRAYYFDSPTMDILYQDMAQIRVADNQAKSEADTLILLLRDNSIKHLYIKGGIGKFRDIWNFYEFLRNIINHISR